MRRGRSARDPSALAEQHLSLSGVPPCHVLAVATGSGFLPPTNGATLKLFLLEFDRQAQRLVAPPEVFDEGARTDAFKRRAELQERAMAEDLDRDIVLLMAKSEADLLRTHASFFVSLDELVDRLVVAVHMIGSRGAPDL